jgi:hypothetical protein
MNSVIQLRKITILPFLIALVVFCFGVSPTVRAACQEGCDLPNHNTFLGDDALLNNTGSDNTAVGSAALSSHTTGGQNTATGVNALFSNITGGQNTATGAFALNSNTFGNLNTAVGWRALSSNDASNNTATGANALYFNTGGNDNTATGFEALLNNTTGTFNTATGSEALRSNSTGSDNTATGLAALQHNTTGSQNTALGEDALRFNTTGNQNIALGVGAGENLTTGDNNIDIGNQGVASESNTIRIGTQGTQTATYIAGVRGAGVVGPAVKVNAAGLIGTAPSAARFKQGIQSMGDASKALFALRPITFRYKQELDPEGVRQFGLVAEEVEKVDPDLIFRDADGRPYTVRYEAVNAMLLNEFLKAHRKMEEQEATMARQQRQIDALTAGLQKVSAQLQLTNFQLQIVAENQ